MIYWETLIIPEDFLKFNCRNSMEKRIYLIYYRRDLYRKDLYRGDLYGRDLLRRDLEIGTLEVCIQNDMSEDIVITKEFQNGRFIAFLNVILKSNSAEMITLHGRYVSGDEVTLMTEKGTVIEFKIK